MHPDAIIAGLRRELGRLDKDAEDYHERRKAIHEELSRVDGLDRPEATAEQPDTVADPNIGYLAGLKRELSRVHESEKERLEQVHAEIERVEALIHKTAPKTETPDLEPDAPADDDLDAKSRADLNEIASGLGIEDPDKLPNKGAVIDAIRSKSEATDG